MGLSTGHSKDSVTINEGGSFHLKSFSAASITDTTSDPFGQNGTPITDPLALFTDFQWFLYRARNTVYFTSFSKIAYDKDALMTLVAKMVTLAPQLTHGFKGALPGAPLPQHLLEAVTSVETVETFEGYPDKGLTPALELFEDGHKPLFRVRALVLKDGPDALERASLIIVHSAHAMMEGADSALLTRSQSSARGPEGTSLTARSIWRKIGFALVGAMAAPFHLVMGQIVAPKTADMRFKSLVFERRTIRHLADILHVRQRALMFALVMFALNRNGRGFSQKRIRTSYTTLDDNRSRKGDNYFRLQAVGANFDVRPDFLSFVKGVDDKLARIEAKDMTSTQLTLNAIFKAHRFLAGLVPFLYSTRFFRFSGNYHMVLTLVPPHRIAGNLTLGLAEPVFAGSYHPGTNLCTFVPGRKFVTFNFAMREKHIADVDAIMRLLGAIAPSET